MMSDLRLFLFGMPRLEYQGNLIMLERRKALALVAYLALMEGQQSREVVAMLLLMNLVLGSEVRAWSPKGGSCQ